MSTGFTPRQLPLDLPHRPAFGEEDLFVSASNELAVRLIDAWPRWGAYGQVLQGPNASGKTHLAHVWQLRSSASVLVACDLTRDLASKILADPPPGMALCIEDIDRGIGDEEALFHLLNMTREGSGHVLLSSRLPITQLSITLPDLRSRLLALPVVTISAPDDALLKAVMVKQFADRQLEVVPDLIEYLFRRMERSLQAVTDLVDALDRGSIGTGRRLSKQLAGQILEQAGTVSKMSDKALK